MGIFSSSEGGTKRMIEFVEIEKKTSNIIDLLNRNDIVGARDKLIQWNKDVGDKLNEFNKEVEKITRDLQIHGSSKTDK